MQGGVAGSMVLNQRTNSWEDRVPWADLCVELERSNTPGIRRLVHPSFFKFGRHTSAMAKYSINIERMFMPKISMIAKLY